MNIKGRNISKKIISLILLIVMVFMQFTVFPTNVKADDGDPYTGFTITTNKHTPITAGESITVTFATTGDKLENFDGIICYDNNIFNEITESDISFVSPWKLSELEGYTHYDTVEFEGYGQGVSFETNQGALANGTILTITLTAKAATTSTEISFNDAYFYVGEAGENRVIDTITCTIGGALPTYTISYNLDGGSLPSGTSNPTTGTVGSDVNIANQPTKTGATFAGWTSSSSAGLGSNAKTGTAANPSTAWSGSATKNKYFKDLRDSSGTVTLTATWTASTSSVTLNNQGATNAGSTSVTATYGQAMPSITLPTKTGYTFNGYFTNTNGGGTKYYNANGSSAKNWDKTGSQTLYASWTANTYTIAYSLDGGSLPSGTSNPTSGTYDQDVNIANVPTKTGSTFAGWKTSTSAGLGANAKTGTAANPSVSWNGSATKNTYFKNLRDTSGTVTLTATWTVNTDKVTLDNQGATTAGTASVNATYGSAMPSITSPTKTGYTFNGYFTQTNGAGTKYYNANGSSAKNWDLNGNQTLYASWTANTYTINYDLNGGLLASGTSNPTSGTYDVDINVANVPTKSGYTFTGWTSSSSNGLGSNAKTGTSSNPSTAWSGSATKNKYFKNLRDTSGTVTLVANWSADTYTITYNLDGGTNSSSNPGTYTAESAAITLTAPTKTGYTFTGWSGTGLTGNNNMTVTIPQGSTGNRTYNANWSKDTYTITYNLDGGTNSSSNPSNYQVDTATITLQDATKDGYNFIGWTGSNGSTPQKNVTIPQGSTGNKTFTANWSRGTYTITYNLDGGTNSSSNPSTYTVDSAVITLQDPTKLGYTFTGWTGSNGTVPQKNVTIPQGSTGNKTYNANWTKDTYTITYNLDGGTNNSSNPSTYQVDTNTITLQEPTKSGFVFAGWTGSNGSTPQKNPTIPKGSTGNKTFNANWTRQTYTISYVLNGGQNSSSNPNSYTVDTGAITLQQPTRAGYTFTGWIGSNGATPQTSVTIPAGSTGNKSYTANWTANTYTVAYNLNGGVLQSGQTNPASGTYDQDLNIASQPKKDGYTFTGWTTSASAGLGSNAKTGTSANPATSWNGSLTKNVYFKNLRDTAGTVTLTANYAEDSYNIAFNSNGGSGSMATMTGISYTETKALRKNLFTRDGYTFKGWATSQSGPKVYNDEQEVSGLSTTNGETVILYAVWEANQYTVTFNGNGVTVSPTSKQVTYDGQYGSMPTPTRPGFDFGGWFFENTNTQVKETDTVKITSNTTLVARWEGAEFTVNFNYNGGSGSVSSKQVRNESTYGDLPTPNTRNGYEFKGWFTDLNDGTQITSTTTVNLTANITLFAHWEERMCRIIFDGNGQTTPTSIPATNAAYGTKYVDLPLPTVTKDGYIFKHWTDSNNNVITNTTTITGNMILTAQWQAAQYTVTLDHNDQTGLTETKQVTYNEPYGSFPTLTRQGYGFKGWFTDRENGTEIKSTDIVKITTNTTLYAHWEANRFTLTLNTNGGEYEGETTIQGAYNSKVTVGVPTYPSRTIRINANGGTASVSQLSQSVTFKKWTLSGGGSFDPVTSEYTYGLTDGALTAEMTFGKVTLPNAQRDGHTFKGWYTAVVGGTKIGDANQEVDLEVARICAQWEEVDYIVTFIDGQDSTGNNIVVGTQTAKYGDSVTAPTKADIVRITGNAHEGHKLSWNKPLTNITENTIISAIWEPEEYTLTYNANGGSVSPSSKQITYGTPYGELPTAVREGFDLVKWTNPDGTEASESDVIRGNTTLTAQWIGQEYSFTINYNDDNNTQRTIRVRNGETFANLLQQLPIPEKTGHDFIKWTDTDGNEITATRVVSPTTPRVINGQYEKKKYTVRYLNDDGSVLEEQQIKYQLSSVFNGTTPTCATLQRGYRATFTGWSYSEDLTSVTHNIDAVAQYQKEAIVYSIEYRNTKDLDNSSNPTTYTVDMGTIALSNLENLEDNDFEGWYTKGDRTGLQVTAIDNTSIDLAISDTIILYAHWSNDEFYFRSLKYIVGQNDIDNYEENDIYLDKIEPDTTVAELIANCDTNGTITVTDRDGHILGADDLVGTGMTIKSERSNAQAVLTAIVMGDLDGDGKVGAADLSAMNQTLLKLQELDELGFKAGDLDDNLKTSATDLSTINQTILEVIKLKYDKPKKN